jgi:hypothetical protein
MRRTWLTGRRGAHVSDARRVRRPPQRTSRWAQPQPPTRFPGGSDQPPSRPSSCGVDGGGAGGSGGENRGEGAGPGASFRPPVAGFDLTFSPSKSVSVGWAFADQGTKAVIYECHRRAIDYTVAYAERPVFHSRSGTNGVLQEHIDGVVAASFTQGSGAVRKTGKASRSPKCRRRTASLLMPCATVRRGEGRRGGVARPAAGNRDERLAVELVRSAARCWCRARCSRGREPSLFLPLSGHLRYRARATLA